MLKEDVTNQWEQFGISLIEVLIVVSIIIVLGLVAFGTHLRQLHKGYDGRRKADLNKIKTAFTNYYNDYGCYPPVDTLTRYCNGEDIHKLDNYLKPVPCDPQTKQAYLYRPYPDNTHTCEGFRVYASLTNPQDHDISRLNCDHDDGCGAGDVNYNYGVSEGVAVSYHESGDSPDTSDPPSGGGCGSGTVGVCCETGGNCNSWDPDSQCSGVVCYGNNTTEACNLCP